MNNPPAPYSFDTDPDPIRIQDFYALIETGSGSETLVQGLATLSPVFVCRIFHSHYALYIVNSMQ
jgi:hypothetical protein